MNNTTNAFTVFSVRIETEKYFKLYELCTSTDRSLSYHIKKAVDKYLEEIEKKKIN